MTEPALVIEDLSVDYAVRGRLRPAVRSVSLTVAPGETVALVGESGSGKTTLAHAVMGLLPDRAVTRAARIDLAGHSLATAAERQWTKLRGRHVGLVPQDPTISLDPVQPIGRQVAEALRIHRLLAGDQAATATALLAAVGLEQPATLLRRYPHELSGGQRQRVLIAIALSCEPQLVIADEPTSGLDVTVQKTVLDHLQERTRALGVAVLLITHDLGLAVDRADRVVVMKVGQTVEQGPARSVLLYPAHPYTAMLAAAVPGLNSARARSRRRLATPTPADGPPLLEVRDLSKVFPGRGGHAPVRAVDHVSFAVHAGRTTALVGASGSGKTTAARLALALERPSGGTVHLDGHEATALRG
ncbi:MAG: ATP-binding cassette domain-containing protein, partial [Propionibacteriaceae bacterium]|nr:ATP-binding cassette domain-containing protein [Propionibacteriaceae bacterium]